MPIASEITSVYLHCSTKKLKDKTSPLPRCGHGPLHGNLVDSGSPASDISIRFIKVRNAYAVKLAPLAKHDNATRACS